MAPRRVCRVVATAVLGAAALLLTVGLESGVAQVGGVWAQGAHTCGDCHGSHDGGAGRGGLVRPGFSELVPQAPGIGPVSERCLLCHGTPGDRVRATSDRPIPPSGAVYLGGSLNDDHPMGVVAVDGSALDLPGPGDPEEGPGGLVPGFDSGNSIECGSCHQSHESWMVTQQSLLQNETCLACHDPEYEIGGHGIASCGSCHRMHGALERDHLTREPVQEYLCGACHRGAPTPLYPGIEAVPATPVHDDPSDSRCQGCHRIH